LPNKPKNSHMIRNLLFGIFTLFFIAPVFSQDLEDDESCLMPDKKILKILKPISDPKASGREISMAYSAAIKAAPDNAYLRFIQAEYNYNRAKNMVKSYEEGRITYTQLNNVYMGAMNGYKKVIEICEDYHATPFYKIGLIYYMNNDKDNAAIYWRKFLDFNHKDPEKYPDDYAIWKKNVAEILPEMEGNKKAITAFYAKTVLFEPHLVNGVSTKSDEFLPMISPDNELIFYTRRVKEEGNTFAQTKLKERFSASERPNTKSKFNEGKTLGAPFNDPSFVDFGGVSLSLDNKEMFICGCKMEQIYGQTYKNCDIYVTYFERVENAQGIDSYKWSALQKLGPEINADDSWEAQPTLSADGNTLYFSKFGANTQKTDIYYSTRKDDGSWSTAKPVPVINTAGHDKTPFLHQDSETMYFSSQTSPIRQGSPEFGNFDMYYSRLQKDGTWSEPKNLGHPINTKNDEVGFVVSTDGHLAYFTSNRESTTVGGLDIYYFELYEDARPQKVMMIKGQAADDEGEPLKGAKVAISYKETGESVEININGDDGKFAAIVNIEEEQDVMVTVKKEGHSFDTKLIKKAEIKQAKIEKKTYINEPIKMEIGKIEVGKSFTIDNILFATNSFELNSDSKFILDQFITFLKENPTVKVTIEGHTDDLGDDAENLTLSENRAKASMDYLVSKGIDKNRLTAKGYGETKPKVKNSSSANRAKNRRTDFMITGM